MLRSRFVATATACGVGAALALTGLGLAPAHAQTVSIVFVEPVVPTQTDGAAIAESQASSAPGRLTDVKIKALKLLVLTKFPIVNGLPTRSTSLNVWSRTVVVESPPPRPNNAPAEL